MSVLNQIKNPINNELNEFQKVFRSSFKSNVPLLNVITRYILSSKGKQMRPMIVLYSSKLFGEINEKTYRSASLIELLHTATLVHDDVVDDSDRRRGMFSINALWKNKIAVLVGDFLLSRGMLLALKAKDYETLEIVSDAVKEMSEGELLQIEKARKLDINESVYYDIIRKKTASLLASCFAVGTASVTDDKETIKKMWYIGENLGMAFQIKDDIFDFQQTNIIGKPTGIDIKEKKMTLPLIYLLNNTTNSEKKRIINSIKRHSSESKHVNRIISDVRNSGGLQYAEEKMLEFKKKAMDRLVTLPDNEARKALELIVDYTISRKK